MSETAPNVLMIYPAFNGSSFWNYRSTCEMVGARYVAPPLGLMTVAALLPPTWPVRLVDLNVATLEEPDLAWADMVMIGGMLPQQAAALRLLEMCRSRGIVTVVGGPDATSSPDRYEAASFRVLGEAESIIGEFVQAYEDGARSGTFEAPKFQADVTTTPIPRFDLIDFSNYLEVNIQFSRGCPFTCEFCDIIELYGRKPRTKTVPQILAELQRLHDLGYRGHVDFVDDNLIGNKKALKALLPHLIDWQTRHNRPFELSTEASLNLADDDALLELMAQAGFFAVFIGIESPDPDVLNATRKKQNTRRDIAASIQNIYDKGMFVIAGFIIGFDEESSKAGKEIGALIEEAAMPVAMAGLLYALPNTQLTRRLRREGRLHTQHSVDLDDGLDDQCTSGLNFVTQRPRAEVLADYRALVDRIYRPEAYFARVRSVVRRIDTSRPNGSLMSGDFRKDTIQALRLFYAFTVRFPAWRGLFWVTVADCLIRNPKSLKPALRMIALFVHLGPFSRFVSTEIGRQVDDLSKGDWVEPMLAAAE
ncbi:B12-binding domain/radical SAM domain protein, family [Hartmannibacter diazotrophicus]|uniref:B12-binding domain/radical SAM domain protein, family n=1 Tax=Hartmannibacter diazotrophicus TaxID=1482074 RepID=A0A2C9D9A3_9HYPH|nr:B12-binding domain-containing radical SAM protein [Hartmannibacter diazotrophicus]SON56914.1 B12-binding domain/radical SAM domain protein, family [Hartmannibacter diazotrophicus]